ncbi:MAG: DUF3592 domain-containing protein [Clostridiaceae bacterium]|nr:DUF3592 domain-containing protein [Clostridiaceae bacterium]
MSKFSLNKKIGLIIVIFTAVIFIAFGLIRISLGFIGEKETAVITDIRRQGGERDDPKPNRYNYAVGYSFTLPDGKKINGSTYKIGDSVYIKIKNSNAGMVNVRYLKAFPQINAIESETGLYMGNIIIIGAGAVMISLIKPRKTRKYKA